MTEPKGLVGGQKDKNIQGYDRVYACVYVYKTENTERETGREERDRIYVYIYIEKKTHIMKAKKRKKRKKKIENQGR